MLTLIKPVINILIEIINLKKTDKAILKEYQHKFIKTISEVELTMQKNNIAEEKTFFIKYAIAAFVDEMIMVSELNNSDQWSENSLQWFYFNEHCAGEKFFEYLEKLKADKVDNIDYLQVYLVFLEFGFAGKYRFKDMEQLGAIKINLRNILVQSDDDAELITIDDISQQKKSVSTISLLNKNKIWLFMSFSIIFYVFIGLLNYLNVNSAIKIITQKTILLL